MGLGTKRFSGDQDVDLGQTLFETGAGEETKPSSPPPTTRRQQQQDHPQKEALKCPRCVSTNTKFCYYNNYNKSQPRHFCKDCKRHWTLGGTLRNVPIGGGRKNKRLKLTDPNDDDLSITTTTTTITAEQNVDHQKTLYSPKIENLDGSDPKFNPNQNQESIDFPFSSIDNLVIPNSYYNESLESYEQYGVGINVVLENLEESISSSITSSAVNNNIPFPWPGPDWNWDDIDHVFTPSSNDHHNHHHINVPWKDESNNDHTDNVAGIKP